MRPIRFASALAAAAVLAAAPVGAGASPAASGAERCDAGASIPRAAAACAAATDKPKPSSGKRPKKKARKKARRFPQTRVTATLLPGSRATVEIPSLPLPGGQVIIGTGVTREVPMSGQISGVLAHRFRIGQDIHVNFNAARFKLDPVDILSDPACGGAPTLRINPASVVGIDRSAPSRAALKFSGLSSATAHVMLRLAFDSRMEPGCDKPLVSTGYAETPFTDHLSGKVGPRGLVALEMTSAPSTLSTGVCLYPGAPDKPCAGGVASYPVKISVYVIVRISLRAGR